MLQTQRQLRAAEEADASGAGGQGADPHQKAGDAPGPRLAEVRP